MQRTYPNYNLTRIWFPQNIYDPVKIFPLKKSNPFKPLPTIFDAVICVFPYFWTPLFESQHGHEFNDMGPI